MPASLISGLAALVLACAAACAPAAAVRPVPAPPAGAFTRPLTASERRWVDGTLAGLGLRDRVAQLVTVFVLGDYTHRDDSSFVQVRRWIEQEHVGGVLMSLGSPLEVAAKVNSMQRLALATGPRVPLLVSSDLEPGLGRFEGGVFTPQLWSAGSATVLPTNMAVGATFRPENAEAIGRILGREARAAGIHVDFAPSADVNNNPGNPVINVRAFGEDPRAVARHTAAFVRGLQAEGVAGVAKHFPGHGDTDADSHTALPVVRSDRARFDAVELVPFRAAIAAGVVGVMSAHIALPALGQGGVPATLAPAVMTGLLRDTLGFRGVTFTDALNMEGVGEGYAITRSCPLAVAAGADVLLYPTDVPRCIDAVVAAVDGGQIARARIDASLRRVLELKVRTGAVSRPLVDLEALRTVVGAPAHWAAARDVAARAVTLLRDSANLVPGVGVRSAVAVVYAPDAEVSAGQQFLRELRAGLPARGAVREFRVRPGTAPATLDSIAQAAATADRLIVMTYTRTFEGAGRLAIPAHIASWIDAQAATGKLVVVAGGNPYVIRQFPRVTSYLVTYGRGEALERASARAVFGRQPITGQAPVSLPGFFAVGDGIQRAIRDGGRVAPAAATGALVPVAAAPPPAGAPALRRSAELDSLLESFRRRYGLPALAVAVVRGDSAILAGAVGVRRLGTPGAVRPEDRFHVGSVTKPLTATLIAAPVEDGILSWATTPRDVFPELADSIHPALRAVTLEQLLAHRAGLQPFEREDETAAIPAFTGSDRERRYHAAGWLLRRAPVIQPGSRYLYSNAGYGLAAAMAERVSGQPWDSLLTRRLFRPLGITSGRTAGWPARAGQQEPWGHWVQGAKLVPHHPDGPYQLGPLIRPAGDVSMSVVDLARFARLHLDGLRGRPTPVLSRATFRSAHTGRDGYGLGWNVRPEDAAPGTGTSSHAGSAGTFIGNVAVLARRDAAIVLLTNTGVVTGDRFRGELIAALAARYAPAP